MKASVRALRGLYAIVDPAACAGRDPLRVAREVLAGGCALLQLRHKRADDEELLRLGEAVLRACDTAGVPFVLNDRPELAMRLGAFGVHLGQGDMPVAEARKHAPACAIGLSTHSLEQARAAEALGADLIGFGPVFETRSKQDPDPVVGVDGLREVLRAVALPVVAIGGIDTHNIAEVAATGVPLAAAIGAICGSDAPGRAAATLNAALLTQAVTSSHGS